MLQGPQCCNLVRLLLEVCRQLVPVKLRPELQPQVQTRQQPPLHLKLLSLHLSSHYHRKHRCPSQQALPSSWVRAMAEQAHLRLCRQTQ